MEDGSADPIVVVRQGYDSVAKAYAAERDRPTPDLDQLDRLIERLTPGASVLDLGCGAGVPIARRLSSLYDVTGMDLSSRQLELARTNVPDARFVLGDMTSADLGVERFDAVVSFYAIIHVPRTEHRAVFARVLRSLRPNGLALLCLGANDIEEDWDEFYGTPMYWSHFGTEGNLDLLRDVGFDVLHAEEVEDTSWPGARHLFVLAQKGAGVEAGGPAMA